MKTNFCWSHCITDLISNNKNPFDLSSWRNITWILYCRGNYLLIARLWRLLSHNFLLASPLLLEWSSELVMFFYQLHSFVGRAAQRILSQPGHCIGTSNSTLWSRWRNSLHHPAAACHKLIFFSSSWNGTEHKNTCIDYSASTLLWARATRCFASRLT